LDDLGVKILAAQENHIHIRLIQSLTIE
jgi:hypothetical protein